MLGMLLLRFCVCLFLPPSLWAFADFVVLEETLWSWAQARLLSFYRRRLSCKSCVLRMPLISNMVMHALKYIQHYVDL